MKFCAVDYIPASTYKRTFDGPIEEIRRLDTPIVEVLDWQGQYKHCGKVAAAFNNALARRHLPYKAISINGRAFICRIDALPEKRRGA